MITLTYTVVSILHGTGRAMPAMVPMAFPGVGGLPSPAGQSQELRQVNLIQKEQREPANPAAMLSFGDIGPFRATIGSSFELLITDPAHFDDYRLGDEVTVTIGGRDG